MSQHKAYLTWGRNGNDFGYKNYSRNHTWDFGHDSTITASAAEQYLGDPSKVDPEQAFVASLASCHMLTFLAIASMRKLVVESYTDEAIGFLEKNESGKMAIARIELHPTIKFSDDKTPTREELEKLHELSHKECFLANSVNFEITTIID